MSQNRKVAKKISGKQRYSKSSKASGHNRKPQRYDSERTEEVKSNPQDAINSPDYYWTGAVVDKQVLNFTFNQFAGVPFNVLSDRDDVCPANIMRIELNPAAGFSTPGNEAADGINMNALKWYTLLTGTNAKTAMYQPQDVSILILYVANILANFSFGARALGLAATTNRRNRAFPEYSLRMAGFDYDDIKNHLADYRSRYNLLVSRFNKITFPSNIKQLQKNIQMFSGMYLDEDGSDMAQIYVLVPHTYWLFNEAYDSEGSGLVTTEYPTWTADSSWHPGVKFIHDYGAFLDALDTQVTKLLTSSTFNFIYADVDRLAKKEGLPVLQLSEIPDNYGIIPMKEEEVSMWINNIVALGEPTFATTTFGYDNTNYNDVKCSVNKNCIIYRPVFGTSLKGETPCTFTPILNFKHDMPTDEEKILSTRLYVLWKDYITGTGSSASHFATYPTLCDWYVANVVIVAGGNNLGNGGFTTSIINSSSYNRDGVARVACALSQFDWHPYLYILTGTNDATPKVFGDVQYYTTLEWQDMKAINDLAIQALMEPR